jgi:hypothetical protein
MWKPKNRNNDIYIGKLARIYCNSGDYSDYSEGKLLFIKEIVSRPGKYSICVEKVTGYPTKTTVSDTIIERVDVQMFEIFDEINKVCKTALIDDMGNYINEYVNPFIAI